MERVQVRPVAGRSIRGVAAGGTVGVSRRDARLLVELGRAEYVNAADAPEAPKKKPRGTPVKKAGAKKAAPKAATMKKAAPRKAAKKAAKKGAKGYKRRDMKAED